MIPSGDLEPGKKAALEQTAVGLQ